MTFESRGPLLAVFCAALLVVLAACPKPPPKKPAKPKSVVELIGQLGSKSEKARKAAEEDLVKKGKEAVEPLIGVLKGETTVKTSVGMGLMGATGAGAATLLKGDASPKAAAARILGKIGDPRAVEPLREALEDEDAGKAAKEALEAITGQAPGAEPEESGEEGEEK